MRHRYVIITLVLATACGGDSKPAERPKPAVTESRMSDPVSTTLLANVTPEQEQFRIELVGKQECERRSVRLVPSKNGPATEEEVPGSKVVVDCGESVPSPTQIFLRTSETEERLPLGESSDSGILVVRWDALPAVNLGPKGTLIAELDGKATELGEVDLAPANARAAEVAWAGALEEGTSKSIQEFMTAFPGLRTKEAQEKQKELRVAELKTEMAAALKAKDSVLAGTLLSEWTTIRPDDPELVVAQKKLDSFGRSLRVAGLWAAVDELLALQFIADDGFVKNAAVVLHLKQLTELKADAGRIATATAALEVKRSAFLATELPRSTGLAEQGKIAEAASILDKVVALSPELEGLAQAQATLATFQAKAEKAARLAEAKAQKTRQAAERLAAREAEKERKRQEAADKKAEREAEKERKLAEAAERKAARDAEKERKRQEAAEKKTIKDAEREAKRLEASAKKAARNAEKLRLREEAAAQRAAAKLAKEQARTRAAEDRKRAADEKARARQERLEADKKKRAEAKAAAEAKRLAAARKGVRTMEYEISEKFAKTNIVPRMSSGHLACKSKLGGKRERAKGTTTGPLILSTWADVKCKDFSYKLTKTLTKLQVVCDNRTCSECKELVDKMLLPYSGKKYPDTRVSKTCR